MTVGSLQLGKSASQVVYQVAQGVLDQQQSPEAMSQDNNH